MTTTAIDPRKFSSRLKSWFDNHVSRGITICAIMTVALVILALIGICLASTMWLKNPLLSKVFIGVTVVSAIATSLLILYYKIHFKHWPWQTFQLISITGNVVTYSGAPH